MRTTPKDLTNAKYISLRYTPEFLDKDPKPTPQQILEAAYGDQYVNRVIVEEIGANLHYHTSFVSYIPNNTARDHFKKIWKGVEKLNPKTGKMKRVPYHSYGKQPQARKEDIDALYQYLYKGANHKTLPVVIETIHTEEEIKEYHRKYWKIAERVQRMKENKFSNVERAYEYLKLKYGKKLLSFSKIEIVKLIQYNKIAKGNPPLIKGTALNWATYIKCHAKADYTTKTLQETIDRCIDVEYDDHLQYNSEDDD